MCVCACAAHDVRSKVVKKSLVIFISMLAISCKSQDNKIEPPPKPIDNPITLAPQLQEASICPNHMIEIKGNYCTKVEQTCSKWMEDPKLFPRARCKEFDKSECIGERLPMHFCIDKEEFAHNYEGLPVSDVSWTQAQKLCEADNKRLCSEEEWIFACEGEDMLPYTTGYVRPSEMCNMDVLTDTVCGKDLCDHRKDISENQQCLSPFGVHNMAGNVDEWVIVPRYNHSKVSGLTMRSGLKGGHWLPVRNRCRPITKDHDEFYHQISIGFRCCSNTN